MIEAMFDPDFYRGKKVLVTGHTGFKGSWLCKVLIDCGADVTGYALDHPTVPYLFDLIRLENRMKSIVGDIRDYAHLEKVFNEVQPQIVFHLAAQPIVRESYRNPVDTYGTNVMGTVNVLECLRKTETVRSFLNVTTDKVYKNREWNWGYRENEELGGYDPYSNSKSCSELVTESYKNSFLNDMGIAVSTARAGNVIGGGDFAVDRIVPDCVRAMEGRRQIVVRNPYSTRPYQHVLEPVMAYLTIGMRQYQDRELAGNYNIGPDETDCVTTGQLVDIFCRLWNEKTSSISGNAFPADWIDQYDGGPHESNFLKLDCSRMKAVFEWYPRWHIEDALDKTIEWTLEYMGQGQIDKIMEKQIKEYGEMKKGSVGKA